MRRNPWTIAVHLIGLVTRINVFRAVLMALTIGGCLNAADIHGTIVIKHRLTKKRVTASAGAYERGAAVELSSDPINRDPLDYERSRVIIFVDGELPSQPANAVMEQKNRVFLPDLVTIPAGSTVSFPNSDPVFHNVFSLSRIKSFDLGNYAKGQTRTVTFSKPGVVMVNCRLHTNMAAVIVVSPNQWTTRADEQGHFVLRNVPAGKYTLIAWHKAAGSFKQMVPVSQTHAPDVEFFIPLDENGRIVAQTSK